LLTFLMEVLDQQLECDCEILRRERNSDMENVRLQIQSPRFMT
jgi:hypothetical protein